MPYNADLVTNSKGYDAGTSSVVHITAGNHVRVMGNIHNTHRVYSTVKVLLSLAVTLQVYSRWQDTGALSGTHWLTSTRIAADTALHLPST